MPRPPGGNTKNRLCQNIRGGNAAGIIKGEINKVNKISFIRFSWRYENMPPMVDIVYKSRRLVIVGEQDLPKTAREFMKTARTKCYFDKTLKCFDIVYTEV